ncbi:DegT/DnrJ/EryC1/StrS family aminotransferase [bacterium]|nr:DegT/DnrJ/EryC1/StrS family aminotransferase [bacterium]
MSEQHPRIPVAKPHITTLEEEYVAEAVRSTWISSTGKFVSRFEQLFSEVTGGRSVVPVCNGTVALHLALEALNIGPGDEVVVPSLTYISTANAVSYVGASPVFAEVDRETWTIDPGRLEECISQRTKAIIPVHLYGHPADMDAINNLASLHGIDVIEDAAEAPMATYKGRFAGTLSRVATFSFYGNKLFTSGEGGALTVSDHLLERRIRILRGQGMDPDQRYYFPTIGFNYRLTNVACALLCAQLDRKKEIIEKRRNIYRWYEDALDSIPGILMQPVASWATLSPWLFSILVDEREYGRTRDELSVILEENNIETRPFFMSIHKLPPYRAAARARGTTLPITERLSETGMNLPTYVGLRKEDVDRISSIIRRSRKG